MRTLIILTISILTFGCSNPDKINLEKEIDINWNDKIQLFNYEIKYVQLNFNPFIDEDVMGKGIEDFMYKDSLYTLDSVDQSRLIEIITDSSNFSRGECGTFALNAGFLIIQKEKIKAIIEMGCGYYQWGFEPWNENSLHGSLSDIGFEKMTIMLDEINVKMK